MEKKIVKQFRFLSPQKILSQHPGMWNDYALLDVFHYFRERKDHKRVAAVLELILRSPSNDEMVDYDELYFELVQNARFRKDYPVALRWAHAGLAYGEQHNSGQNRGNWLRDIGEIYLYAGMLDSGLAIFTRCLETDPNDIWIYNALGITLLDVGMVDLALEVIERALEMIAEDDLENLQAQLIAIQEEARTATARKKRRQTEVTLALLANLRTTLRLSSAPQEGWDVYLPPIDSLISLKEGDRESVCQEILERGQILAPDLIRLAFDENLTGTPAPGHAVALLRRLWADRTVELAELKSWLERAQGNWQRELLTRRAGKIGGYYTGELEVYAADTTKDLYSRSMMVSALAERAQKCPDQRERIIQGMRELLTRPEAYEAAEEPFIGFLIAEMEDMGAKELYPEIEAAFAEDRVDPTVISLSSVQESWEMPVSQQPKPREDGLYLRLSCKECERVRQHFVEHIILDTFTQEKVAAGKTVKYDPFIMDHEIICPKCGARDRYTLTADSYLTLLVPANGLEAFADSIDRQDDKPPWELNPRVEVIGSMVFNRPMHPLEGLERYKKLIVANPRDSALYFRMGALLRTIHRYPQSLEAYRQGYERGTDDLEFILHRAMAEHDFGDRALAKELYEETIASIEQNPGDDPYVYELAHIARRGLKLLKRKKASPWQAQLIEQSVPGAAKSGWTKRRKKKPRPKKRRRRK